MNIKFIGFMAFIVVIILIVLVVIMLRYMFKEKKEAINKDIIINGLSDYCDGYGLIMKDSKEANKDKIRIDGYPRDINWEKLKEDSIEIKKQTIFVKKNLLVPLSFSANRNMYLALPNKPEYLPEEVKKTHFGKYLMAFISDMNQEKYGVTIEEIKQRNLSEVKRLSLDGGNDIIREFISPIKDIVKDLSKDNPIIKEEDKK